jgi:hypothetical protein
VRPSGRPCAGAATPAGEAALGRPADPVLSLLFFVECLRRRAPVEESAVHVLDRTVELSERGDVLKAEVDEVGRVPWSCHRHLQLNCSEPQVVQADATDALARKLRTPVGEIEHTPCARLPVRCSSHDLEHPLPEVLGAVEVVPTGAGDELLAQRRVGDGHPLLEGGGARDIGHRAQERGDAHALQHDDVVVGEFPAMAYDPCGGTRAPGGGDHMDAIPVIRAIQGQTVHSGRRLVGHDRRGR